MDPESKYPYTSIDYINSLDFDYIETFSLQRGEDYSRKAMQLKRYRLNQLQVKKSGNLILTDEEENSYNELSYLLSPAQYLSREDGSFHPSAELISTFEKSDPMVSTLISILQTEVVDVPQWMCAPVYRDAVVFYKKPGKMVSVLNVCLSCDYMETQIQGNLDADSRTYEKLKQFFISIGHPVEKDLPWT